MSDVVIVDVNNKPIANLRNDPPKKGSPDREILRLLRIIETARRTDLADLCASLDEASKSGWSLTVDKNLPEFKAEVTLITHLDRDADNKLRHKPERWIRLGCGYLHAMKLLKENNK